MKLASAAELKIVNNAQCWLQYKKQQTGLKVMHKMCNVETDMQL